MAMNAKEALDRIDLARNHLHDAHAEAMRRLRLRGAPADQTEYERGRLDAFEDVARLLGQDLGSPPARSPTSSSKNTDSDTPGLY